MRRAGIAILALLVVGLTLGPTPLTDRTGVQIKSESSFSGNCATGQIGMASENGKTFTCVSGSWQRTDLPQCSATEVVGAACARASVCLNRSAGAIYICNSTNVWQLIAGGDGGTSPPAEGAYNYSQAFTDETSLSLTHNLGTPNVLVSCYDTNDVQILPDTVDIDPGDPWNVTVQFEIAQTGRCVVNGSGNGTSGGTEPPPAGSGITLREDGAAKVTNATVIDFLSGFDVSTLGQVSLDYTERPVNLGSSESTGTLPISKGGTNNTSFTSNTCIRYDGTRLVSAAADCGGSPGSSCVDVDNDCLADQAEGLNCNASPCVSLGIETTGVLGASQGGVGMTVAYPDAVIMGYNSASWNQFPVPDCNETTQKLMYDASDTGAHPNQWFCGVDYQDASGSPPVGPEGAIQFYEGGALGSNASLLWTEATTLFKAPKIEASTMYRGQGAFARFDIDRDDVYDITMEKDTVGRPFVGFSGAGGTNGFINWGPGNIAFRVNGTSYTWLDYDGDATREAGDFCIRENGLDSNCDDVIDFIPVPDSDWTVLVGNLGGKAYIQAQLPDCSATGNALNYSRSGRNFSCRTITGGGGSWALGLDSNQDGTNVQVDVDGATVDFDPDADGALEARINADGSIETFGAADEAGGLGSNGQLIFTADDNNNGTGEGMEFDFDGDGAYELSADGSGNLTMSQGALIPGVCASVASASTITADNCNVVTLTGSTSVNTINTCNAANLGRQLIVVCGTGGTFGSGNLKLAGSRPCSSNDVLTLVCDGTNWLEVSWSVNAP